LCSVSYQWFSKTPYNEADFYGNAYYFFYSVSPHISLLVCLTGVFLLFPEFSKRKFFLVIPGAYHFAKMIWLAQVDNNTDFHRMVPWSVALLGVASAVAWYCAWDYIMGLHFHKREGTIARIIGIMSSPGITPSEKERLAKAEIATLKNPS
jgi:hypothetical protein